MKHQRQPAESTGFDQVAVARAHRIAIDPLGGNVIAATTLDGIIQRKHQRPLGEEGLDEQTQQDLAPLYRRPDAATEFAMFAVSTHQLPGS